MLSTFVETRLSRYAIAAGAVVAAIPTQAAPITVILPSPVFVETTPLLLDIDGVDGPDLVFFSGSGPAGVAGVREVGIGLSGSFALALPTGFQFFSAFTSSDFWGGTVASLSLNTSTSPNFVAIGFDRTNGGFGRLAFLQFEGKSLYGYAWEAGASSLTTFDLRGSSSDVPEPATGALAALALGALAVAARKRKQA
jgi:hypothetical protein